MQTIRINTLSLLFTVLSLFFITGSTVAESSKIILYPFAIHSENDLTFLQKGISDSIESRLESHNHPVVIGATSVNQDHAVEKASADAFDFAITGSLTFFGDTISINALFLDVKTGETLVSLSKTETDKNTIFTHMESFASDINASFKPKEPATVPAPTPAEVPAGSKLLDKGIVKSDDFKVDAVAMSTGDVNGDGINDIVFIDTNDVHIASYNGKEITLTQTISGKRYLTNHYVHTADINSNGTEEIFVTAVHSNSRSLMSYVLEWNGTEFSRIVDKTDWFFAVTKLPESDKPVLLGQKQNLGNVVFTDSISQLVWNPEQKNYIAGTPVTLPSKKLTIYDIDSADMMGKGSVNLIAYTPGDLIVAFDNKQEEIWRSTNRYGGSYKYIEPRKIETNERVYMRPRLFAGDADLNGKTDIITIINENSTPRFLSNLRSYNKGYIECLNWNSLNLETLWKTQPISGYIADFHINDLNSDGKNELIYCVTHKVGKIIKKRQTYIVIQQL